MKYQMDFFAPNEQVAQIEADLRLATGPERVRLLLALAWQLRQRDTQRSLALGDEVHCLLINEDWSSCLLPERERQRIRLRLTLIRSEVKWLFADIDAAKVLSLSVLQGFNELNDTIGCADAYWVLAWIAFAQGDQQQINVVLENMAVAADGIDPVRVTVARAMMARNQVFIDVLKAKQCWDGYFARLGPDLHPSARCWVEDYLGTQADRTSDYVGSIRHLSQAYNFALATGQLARAMNSASKIGNAFNSLNEYHAALEWMQRGLALAKKLGWTSSIGNLLMQTAETLRLLRHLDSAYDMARDALQMLASVSASRAYAIALQYLAKIELDRQQADNALATFQKLEQRAVELNHQDLLSNARRGQAGAWLQLAQPERAQQMAQAAMAAAQADTLNQIAALRVMAQIYAQYPLPPPSGANSETPLHYLLQALALAATIADYIVPGDLLDVLAQEYARLGNYQQAARFARQASLARDKIHSREANNRAHALQLLHRNERAQAEDAHLRELASEAKRAEILQQTSADLAHLAAIGQEITASLEIDSVCEVLYRHVRHLFDMNVFGVALIEADGMHVCSIFAVEDDEHMAPMCFSLSDPTYYGTRCVRERQEILIDQDPALEDPFRPVGKFQTLSRLLAPLCLGERVLGGVTVQSRQRYAYGPREQLIFRTLCAYTAIALSNASAHGELAQAHQQLQETQQQLVLQEKMAGLGMLTAGVAHEINNPGNFVHVAAQNQGVDLAEFEQFVARLVETDASPEILHAFKQRFDRLSANLMTMLNGTERIKGIVQDLRAFARLDQAEKKTTRISECVQSTINLVRTSWLDKVEFITEFAADPEIECWPALLNQVCMNLLVNACQAIQEKQLQQQPQHRAERGKVWLRLQLHPDQEKLLLSIQDNGVGIDVASQARIMEPFYTTKQVGVGMGLGLSIAFGIVQKHGGCLDVSSTPGEGSCFTIQLPLS